MEGSSLGIQEPQEDVSSPSVPSSTGMPVTLVGTSSEISLGPCTDIASGPAATAPQRFLSGPSAGVPAWTTTQRQFTPELLYSGRDPSSGRAVRATSWQRRNGRDSLPRPSRARSCSPSSASLGGLCASPHTSSSSSLHSPPLSSLSLLSVSLVIWYFHST